MDEAQQQDIIGLLLEGGFLAGPDLFSIQDLDKEKLASCLPSLPGEGFLVLTKDVYMALRASSRASLSEINWLEFDGSRVMLEKWRSTKPYHVFLDILAPGQHLTVTPPSPLIVERPHDILLLEHPALKGAVGVVKSYEEPSKKRVIKDFVTYYKHRYTFCSQLLRHRAELQNLVSINRLKGRQGNEPVSLIGLVYNTRTTKNGNVLLTLEDATGHFTVFISKDGPLKDIIPYLTYDEVIGVCGFLKNELLFAKTILFPDVPHDFQPRTTPDEVCAAFISDVHVGSKVFLEKDFLRFIDWLNGKEGHEDEKALAKKVKYLFVVGDVVDGVGVYPGQEFELALPDVYEQYRRTKELLSLVRPDIHIIMCPGNHDAVRIAEPQPRVNEFSDVLLDVKNLTLVSNPALVAIHAGKDFEGVRVLMYHGYSYDYYAAEIEPIRAGGAYDRADLIMKFLLQKRHLAPSHTSTLYLPSIQEDPLLIDKIPDIFVSGHVHKSAINTYNGVLLIGCSCWQAKTAFQEKMGHNPDPGRVPVVNLKTREVTVLNFCDGDVG